MIPYDNKAATNAAKLGQTFVDANHSSKASAIIREVAQSILGASEEGADPLEAGGKKSLMGKFDFKSLLSKKGRVAESAD